MSDYKYDIFEAILRIRAIEGEFVIISIPIPNPIFKYLKYTEYPYSSPFIDYKIYHNSQVKVKKFMIEKLFLERINPYLHGYGAIVK